MSENGSAKREKGYVHVYTGKGKGKTTAALGLVLRAVGAGWRVLLVQFLKKGRYSEIKALESLGDRVTVLQFGSGRFVRGRPDAEDVSRAVEGLEETERAMMSGRYDLVVLDEVNCALRMGLIPVERVEEFLQKRPQHVEVVLTGRGAPERILRFADLVTRMEEVKHYFRSGVQAREGIEK